METITLIATFDRDSKRYHVFPIDANGEGITGAIYVPKGEDIPDEVVVELKTRNDS